MIEQTFYVYKDNKTSMYLRLIQDNGYYSSGGSYLVLIPNFESAFRFNNPENNRALDLLKSGNSKEIWEDFSLMKSGIRNKHQLVDLELMIEKYCTQTIFLSSEKITCSP